MESRIEEFTTKYNIDEDGMKEMLNIFNTSLLDIGNGILKISKSSKDKIVNDKQIDTGEMKWASKKAGEYAKENGIELNDFKDSGSLKITKADVDKRVRVNAKVKASPGQTPTVTPKKTNKVTVLCSGLTQKGEPCGKAGTHKPDGAKNNYCFRHAEDFKTFECSSDSSDDSSDEDEKKPITNKKTVVKDDDDDEELTEDI